MSYEEQKNPVKSTFLCEVFILSVGFGLINAGREDLRQIMRWGSSKDHFFTKCVIHVCGCGCGLWHVTCTWSFVEGVLLQVTVSCRVGFVRVPPKIAPGRYGSSTQIATEITWMSFSVGKAKTLQYNDETSGPVEQWMSGRCEGRITSESWLGGGWGAGSLVFCVLDLVLPKRGKLSLAERS